MVIIGLVGVVGAWGAYLTDSELERSGPRATGVVLKKEFLRAADGDSDHLVTYRFALPSGEGVVSQRGLGKAQWTGINVGSSLVIVYSPANPKRNFPEGSGVTSIAGPIVLTAMFGFVALLGGSVLVQGLRSQGGEPGKA